MYGTILIPVSIALCWMLSPDALVLIGNSFGRGGMVYLVPLGVGLGVSIMAVNLLHHPALSTVDTRFSSLAASVKAGLLATSLAGYLSLVLFLPAGMLVTAGYTFNETFVYWFPNFAFSFLLLGAVLLLHLAGEHVVLLLQPIFIGVTMTCLVLLCLAGLAVHREGGVTPLQPQNLSTLSLPLLLSPFLLFLGYERQNFSAGTDCRPHYRAALIAFFIIAALWGLVSVNHAGLDRLAGSTVPHMLSAREILGQPGRIIMGIGIISGTCGVVNGLFFLSQRRFVQFRNLLFPPSSGCRRWPRYPQLAFSLLIATFMATGLAGSEKLETLIYGALLLWLLNLGMQCITAAALVRHAAGGSPRRKYITGGIFPLAALALATTHPDADLLFRFCFFSLAAGATASCGFLWLSSRACHRTQPYNKGDFP